MEVQQTFIHHPSGQQGADNETGKYANFIAK